MCESEACPGNKALLRLTITNCGMTARTIKVTATNAAVTVEPASLNLGPMEEGEVNALARCSGGSDEGPDAEEPRLDPRLQGALPPLDGRGCGRLGQVLATDAVEVEDCPDLIHHWYDHFYCQRPCLNRD